MKLKPKTRQIIVGGFFLTQAIHMSQARSAGRSDSMTQICLKEENKYFHPDHGCMQCDMCLPGQGKDYDQHVRFKPGRGHESCVGCRNCASGFFNPSFQRQWECQPCTQCRRSGRLEQLACNRTHNTFCIRPPVASGSSSSRGGGMEASGDANEPPFSVDGHNRSSSPGHWPLFGTICGSLIVIVAIVVIFGIIYKLKIRRPQDISCQIMSDYNAIPQEENAPLVSSVVNLPVLSDSHRGQVELNTETTDQPSMERNKQTAKRPKRMLSNETWCKFKARIKTKRWQCQSTSNNPNESQTEGWKHLETSACRIQIHADSELVSADDFEVDAEPDDDFRSKPTFQRMLSYPMDKRTEERHEHQDNDFLVSWVIEPSRSTESILTLLSSQSLEAMTDDQDVFSVQALPSITHGLGFEDLDIIAKHTAPCCLFKRLGGYLGLDDADIGIIVENNPGNVNEQAYRTLTKWTEKLGPSATRATIYMALRYIKREDIIHKLESSKMCRMSGIS